MDRSVSLAPLALVSLAALPGAQSNGDPAIDLRVLQLEDVRALDRVGAFPNGVNRCSLQTVVRNTGTAEVAWQAAMDPDHPFLAFLFARESNGRFEQISDRGFVKHAYNPEAGGGCSPSGPGVLGLGCTDTYSAFANGWYAGLGPPDEVDPWLATWDPVCSHFDRGEPPVAPPADCDGVRSLTSSSDVFGHAARVRDADLAVPGAAYWCQVAYVVQGELDAARADSLSSCAIVPAWDGSQWTFAGQGSLHGSVLGRWSGATVGSASNGGDDGRFYVGVRVTGPDSSTGLWHYEYAVHDRDNRRGASELRIPLCAGARVLAAGFGDVDESAANDWSAAVVGNELVFSGPSNPLRWNTIFNFWFDSDAAPLDSAVTLVQASPGPGAASLSVASRAPLALYNVWLGPGCALDAPPTLFAVGSPPRATLGNATFGLRSTENAPNQPSWLRYSIAQGSYVLAGCERWLGPAPGQAFQAGVVSANAAGVAERGAAVPNDPALEGLAVQLQCLARDPGNGVLRGNFELSSGLRVRVGSAIPGCP